MSNSASSPVREVVFERFGEPDVLQIRTRGRIHPKVGQVLIKTVSCGVNPIDAKIRSGRNFVCERRKGDPFPWTLGFDAAGIVIEALEGSRFHAGDRVTGNAGCPIHPCAYAEEVLLDEDKCVRVPEGMDLKAAGALTTAAITALSIVDLMPEGCQKVLVAGGAGGVGHLLVRYLKKEGFAVSCTCSKLNLEFMRSLGIEDCHDYREALPASFDGGFDVVVDMPGGDAGIALYRYLRQGGKMITVPTITEQKVIAAAPKNTEAVGVRCIRSAENYARMMKYALGGVMPVISGCMSFDEVARAHELIATGHVRGKLILVP